MKKIMFGLMLVVLFLGACASPVEAPIVEKEVAVVELAPPVEKEPEISVFQKAQNGKPLRFVYVFHGDPFMNLMLAGWLQGCDDYGVLCEHSYISGLDEPALLAYADTITAENTSGVLMPMWGESRWIIGNKLVEDGVPLVAPHMELDASIVPGMVAWAAPDADAFGHKAGKAMAEKVQCEGPIAFSQSDLNPMQNRIMASFRLAFKELCPDTELLEIVAIGAGDMAKSIALSSAVIIANPDLKAAFSTTANGAQSWAGAAKDSGKEVGEIVIMGMDYMEANLDMVKSGEIWALVGQPAYEESYYSVALLVNNLMGPVPYENYLPSPIITLENVDDFYVIVEKAKEAMND